MKNDFEYEFEFMVNNHHKHERINNSNVSSDHEIRMEVLRRKVEAERRKATREAIKFGLMMVVGILFMIMGYFAIKSVWFYSIAVRGF